MDDFLGHAWSQCGSSNRKVKWKLELSVGLCLSPIFHYILRLELRSQNVSPLSNEYRLWLALEFKISMAIHTHFTSFHISTFFWTVFLIALQTSKYISSLPFPPKQKDNLWAFCRRLLRAMRSWVWCFGWIARVAPLDAEEKTQWDEKLYSAIVACCFFKGYQTLNHCFPLATAMMLH